MHAFSGIADGRGKQFASLVEESWGTKFEERIFP